MRINNKVASEVWQSIHHHARSLIFRGNINRNKYNFNARIVKNNVLLLELHISPGNKHTNPDGEIIVGSHWHIYSEEYGRRFAYAAEDIESDKFVDNTIIFFDKFNLIEKPDVGYQAELI